MTHSSDSSKTLLALKASSRSRNLEEQKQNNLRRDCVVLISSFLSQFGYSQTASQLQTEARSVLGRYYQADNIDLNFIVSEFEEIYTLKNGRKPKFSRRKEVEKTIHTNDTPGKAKSNRGKSSQPTTSPVRVFRREKGRIAKIEASSNQLLAPRSTLANSDTSKASTLINDDNGFLKASGINPGNIGFTKDQTNEREPQQPNDERLIKPLPPFDDFELRNLASSIQSDILETSPNIKWDDIVGINDAKRLLKEAIVLPLQFPCLFQGLLTPWRGILLFGLPGTGKTLLAKAVATETDTTFFNISASSIVSKFRGDSEKLIKVLFDLARYHAPSTIFFDEIDAIMSHRGSGQSTSGGEGTEHEGSRRMKTELLVEMDGLGKGSQHVFVLAASNLPWDLDPALLRRLDKRIHVPPPNAEARKTMIQKHLTNHANNLTEKDFDECAASTESYSGADIKLVCKETVMIPIRSILKMLEQAPKDPMQTNSASTNHPVSAVKTTRLQKLLEENPVSILDFQKSLLCTKSSLGENAIKRYEDWAQSYGCT